MILTRRNFLKNSAVGIAGAMMIPRLLAQEAKAGKIRISARHFGGNFEGAKKANLDGVEICISGGSSEKLEISDPKVIGKYKDAIKSSGIPASSISMDFLNGHPLATATNGQIWVEQTIAACREIGATHILLPFFGGAHLLNGQKEFKKAEVDSLVTRLKALAPKAKEAGVTLGIECTLSAKQYIELLDRVGSDSVGAYYDIGNCTGAGFDVPGDIKTLGNRIAIFHFKDGGAFLGEGKVKMEPVCETIKTIGYKGWIVLETSCPTKDTVADCKRNADFSRKLLGIQAGQ